jgi:hypothetical protein
LVLQTETLCFVVDSLLCTSKIALRSATKRREGRETEGEKAIGRCRLEKTIHFLSLRILTYRL